jgi:carbohydrate-selective porin OprB
MKKLTHLLLLCFTAISSIFCASAADQDNSTVSGLGGIFSEIHWHPALFKGPIEIKDGQILSGTSGTIGGERSPAPDDDISKPFNDWWNGKYMLGGGSHFGFDIRQKLADEGVSFNGNYQGAFFGVVDSEKGARGFWDQQLNFGNEINFGKLLGNENLEGVIAFSSFRYRDSTQDSNPNNFVKAQSMFNPSNWQSGTQFRVLAFGAEIGTKGLLPIKDMFVFRGGWLQPQKEFADQPLSKLFLNNAVNSAKGIGGNIPFSSSFSTWGGTLKVKLHDTFYVKNGLFMSYPQATASTNHGLAYQGYGPATNQNGLFYMGETGYTPTVGESQLPGKYAFGGYFYGTPADKTKSWNGTKDAGQYGFYFQADQMLYREPTETPAPQPRGDGKSVASGKSFKAPVGSAPRSLSPQGLNTFNLLSFAPGYAVKNTYPFYFQSGLVYTGLIPTRNEDLTMISIGYGAYQGEVSSAVDGYTAVIEGGYRFQINGWSYVQPFAQYFSHPNGSGTAAVQNATVLGFLVGLVF